MLGVSLYRLYRCMDYTSQYGGVVYTRMIKVDDHMYVSHCVRTSLPLQRPAHAELHIVFLLLSLYTSVLPSRCLPPFGSRIALYHIFFLDVRSILCLPFLTFGTKLIHLTRINRTVLLSTRVANHTKTLKLKRANSILKL